MIKVRNILRWYKTRNSSGIQTVLGILQVDLVRYLIGDLFICVNKKYNAMRVTLNLNLDLHEDFLLTCEVLHVDVNDAD